MTLPRLAAVAAGTAPMSDASAPIAELVDDVTVGSVTRVGDGDDDIAAHHDGHGTPLPMSAPIAVQAGAQADRNAAHLLESKALQPAKLTQHEWGLDLGGGRGETDVKPFPIAMPLLDRPAPALSREGR